MPSSATSANSALSGARRRGSSSCMSRRALNWSAGATARTVFVAARAGHTCRSSAAAFHDARLLTRLGLPRLALECSQTQSRPANFLGSCVFQAEWSASKSTRTPATGVKSSKVAATGVLRRDAAPGVFRRDAAPHRPLKTRGAEAWGQACCRQRIGLSPRLESAVRSAAWFFLPRGRGAGPRLGSVL